MESEQDNDGTTKILGSLEGVEQVVAQREREILKAMNIYQRLARIRGEVQKVEKSGKHKHFSFAKHDDVTATLAPLYLKYGVDREVSINRTERSGAVLAVTGALRWINIDKPDDYKAIGIFAEGVDVGHRQGGEPNIDGLAVGKAISYAVKIAELKNFCLVGESTPDSERASIGAPVAAPPSSGDYLKLKELYDSCSSEAELKAIRGMVMPLVQGKALDQAQVAELSKLDHEAKQRIQKESGK